jgi:hypothetical protein
MRQPHELMADDYCGPSNVIDLGQIKNVYGFRFIGIDTHGSKHYCIVRKGDSGSFYMSSNTALFQDLCGWLPDMEAPNAELRREP